MGSVEPASGRERRGGSVWLLAALAWAATLVGAMAGGNGRLLAIAGLAGLASLGFHFLSQLRKIERDLAVSRADFDRMVDLPGQVRWMGDADGRFRSMSARWTKWTGLTLEETRDGKWESLLHPSDREQVTRTWAEALTTERPIDLEFRMMMRDGDYHWLRGRATPHLDETDRLEGWVGLVEDVTERRVADEKSRQTSDLLEMIGISTDSFLYAKDSEGKLLYANRAVVEAAGADLADMLGKTDAEWSPNPEEAAAFARADQAVMSSGKPQDVEELFTGSDGKTRYYRSLKNPLRDTDGKVIGIVGISTDITERREAEDREHLLGRELDHRAKNILAVVQSVVALTRAEDVDQFKTAVTGRILALGRAHSMLSASRWDGADLQRIVSEELEPYVEDGPGRIEMSGPPLVLKPDVAQSIALVVHELATNAAKYGALSRAEGSLRVSWGLAPSSSGPPILVLNWKESGGPPLSPASPRGAEGFGSRLIRNSIERQLRGEIAFDWANTGLNARLKIPLEARPEQPASAAMEALASQDDAPALPVRGKSSRRG